MNYLSHYYFDKDSNSPELILGGLLPDLVRGFQQKGVHKPSAFAESLNLEPGTAAILRGWQRHKAIDKYFHASSFFVQQTEELKQELLPYFKDSGTWTFFLAHILLEISLDALLIKTGRVDAGKLYAELEKADPLVIIRFFRLSGSDNAESFQKYLDNFIHLAYLHAYKKDEGIIYALDRICERLWKTRFTDKQKEGLALVIPAYLNQMEARFMQIFDEIEKLELP